MSPTVSKTPLPVAGWIILCAFLNCAGWVLSALHQLNLAGYAAVVLLGSSGLIIFRRGKCGGWEAFLASKLTKRFRRPFALGFLLLAALAFAGGILHAPSNFDGLSYRTPRVLQWLAADGWHWIHTGFQRLNVRAVGFEWITAPLLLFTRSDRLLFLVNFVSFLLLPGLVFSVFTRLGFKPRAAWYWMWLLPSGYGYLLQAASIGNDLFGATFGLAALDLALRARSSRRLSDVWLSCLAAALLSGGKTSNLPLLLPWFVALLPSLPLIRQSLVRTSAVAIVAACSSFLPVAVANYARCHDWTGQALEGAQFQRGSPTLYLTQNAALLAVQNLVPPVFPAANAWNRLMERITPADRQAELDKIFERVGAHLAVGELEMEEDAGIGFGVSLLVLATVIGTILSRPGRSGDAAPPATDRIFQNAVVISAWVCVLPYMLIAGSSTPARILLPCYGPLFPLLLRRQTGDWVRRNKWWRCAAYLVFLLAGVLLVISPARPLWPARFILSKLHPESHALLTRADAVYTVYGERSEAFAPVLDRLPEDATVLGVILYDYPETSLWKPFFHRRILHVLPDDAVTAMTGRGIKYVLISHETMAHHARETLEQWIARTHAEVLWTMPLRLRASQEGLDWTLVKLPPAGTKSW